MSVHAQPIDPIPEETARVARAAFPKGNPYMGMRDELGVFYQDEAIAALFPARGQPAESPWRVALVLVLQYAEGLSDQQAATAVRGRIDWKYALSLELTDPGFEASVLSEFRSRLVAGSAEQTLLDTIPGTLQGQGFAQSARAPAHRFHSCAGCHPHAESAGVRRGDAAPHLEQLGGRCS
jgi:transposase